MGLNEGMNEFRHSQPLLQAVYNSQCLIFTLVGNPGLGRCPPFPQGDRDISSKDQS